MDPQTFNVTKSEGLTSSFTIRAPTTDDYPRLLTLLPKVTRCNLELDADTLKAHLSSGSGFHPFIVTTVQNDEEIIVAYAAVYTMVHLGRIDFARLEHVVVEPHYRGFHIGSHLVKYTINYTKEHLNCDRIDLTVENPIAKHIYVAMGFKMIETEVMRLSL